MSKSTILSLIVVVIAVLGFVLLSGGNEADQPAENTTQPQKELSADIATGTYSIATASSTVQWTARKTLVDGYEDTGEFPVSGEVTVATGRQLSATTTFDMANLEVVSVSNQNAGTDRLASHLRSEDFFAVDQYPTSSLATTDVTSASSATTSFAVTADLTMKGVTNEVSFPAEIGMSGDDLIVRADTEIDRSRWNVRYGSPSFFNDLGNNVIGDMVDISVDIVAVPEN
jgi:polyisoprenoid-binding protein YceI